MKILVFSDSHNQTANMIEVIESRNDIDMVIHLGDLVRDVEEIESIYSNLKFEYVAGNNDWFSSAEKEKVLYIEGKRIFITHGNQYGVKNGYSDLIRKGASLQADAIFFGHTHIAYESIQDNILVVNPGSISQPALRQEPSYCFLEIGSKEIKSKLLNFTRL